MLLEKEHYQGSAKPRIFRVSANGTCIVCGTLMAYKIGNIFRLLFASQHF